MDRLPRCGLGTMKDVRAKKLASVATAALFTVRAHTMVKISGSIPVKSPDDDGESLPGPLGHGEGKVPRTNNIVAVIHTKWVSKRLRPLNETALTQEVAAGAATKPLPSKKKVECKLVRPAVLTEEPEIDSLDVCLTASGPQEETLVLVNPEERITSHLACTSVSTSGLVYPPLPTEQEIYSAEQEMTHYLSRHHLSLTEPVSQHRPFDGFFPQVNPDSSALLLELESELAADHSSATALANGPHQLSLSTSDRKKNQGDHTLVRPIAPAEDPELFGVNNVEWTPPAMEEGEIAELMDKQLKILLSIKRKKVNNVKVKASTLTQEVLTSSSATKLTETSFPEEMTETSSTEVPAPQTAQQMVYWAFPMPYALLAAGYLPQNSGPTATSGRTVPPTVEQQLQPLAAELQPPQYAMHTSPGTGEF